MKTGVTIGAAAGCTCWEVSVLRGASVACPDSDVIVNDNVGVAVMDSDGVSVGVNGSEVSVITLRFS